MSDIKIFGNDDFYVYDFLLRKGNAADIIVSSLFKDMAWYELLKNTDLKVFLYSSDIQFLVRRLETINNGIPIDNILNIKLIIFAIDGTTGKAVSIGQYISFNHEKLSFKTSFSLSNIVNTYTVDSYKYNITLYELESFNEVVGESKMITRISVPYGFMDTIENNGNLDRYNGCLLCLNTLKFNAVSWLADTQQGENYNTLSLYICIK